MVSDQDKATVLVLCAYRALRTYGDLHGVSVHQTLQQRRLRAKLNKLWMDEYQQKLQEHRARLVVKIQRMVDRKVPQLLFLLASLIYCGAEVFDFVRTSQVLGYVLLVAFGCEFLIRTKAQGGEIFFRPLFNKLEFFVLTAGTWCLFYASWYTQYLASSKAEATAVAAATATLLLLHRCIRLLGIQLKASPKGLAIRDICLIVLYIYICTYIYIYIHTDSETQNDMDLHTVAYDYIWCVCNYMLTHVMAIYTCTRFGYK